MVGNTRDGGYSEKIVVPARNLVAIPDEVAIEHAAVMMCSSATSLHALNKTRFRPGERLAIFGLGGLGQSAVQLAFAGERNVFTLSIHESGRWPGTGDVSDRGGGNARNLPVPPGFNDAELAHLLARAVLPLGERFAADAVVVTGGADALAGDPLSRLALGNTALWQAVTALCLLTPRTLVLGGGGYNPWTLGRCWSGLWGTLCGDPIPAELPAPARALLAALECDLVDEDDVDPRWLDTLADPCVDAPVRAEVAALARAVMVG